MALSDADAARLASLQAAYDRLITGSAIAEVEYAGEKRRFAPADVPVLRQEIARLNNVYGAIRTRL